MLTTIGFRRRAPGCCLPLMIGSVLTADKCQVHVRVLGFREALTPEARFPRRLFRDCMKSGLRVVIHYSSTYEKTLPDGSFRCRMELHTAPSARTQRARTAQDPRSSRDPRRRLLRP